MGKTIRLKGWDSLRLIAEECVNLETGTEYFKNGEFNIDILSNLDQNKYTYGKEKRSGYEVIKITEKCLIYIDGLLSHDTLETFAKAIFMCVDEVYKSLRENNVRYTFLRNGPIITEEKNTTRSIRIDSWGNDMRNWNISTKSSFLSSSDGHIIIDRL